MSRSFISDMLIYTYYQIKGFLFKRKYLIVGCRYTYKSAPTPIGVMALTSVTVDRHAWFTLGILSSTLLVVFFSETMLLPAIPEIMQDFSISYGTLHGYLART